MIEYGKTRSTVKPQPIEVDEYSVWVYTNITPVSEYVGTENAFVGFEFDMVQYDIEEYGYQQAAELKIAQQSKESHPEFSELYKTNVANGGLW